MLSIETKSLKLTWHVGEVFPCFSTEDGRVIRFDAYGDELAWLLDAIQSKLAPRRPAEEDWVTQGWHCLHCPARGVIIGKHSDPDGRAQQMMDAHQASNPSCGGLWETPCWDSLSRYVPPRST